MKTLQKNFPHALCALFFVCLMATITRPLFAETPVRVAFLSIDNLSTDPRYDYLSGIIQGILLFDLSDREGLEMVEREDMDSVLKEQKLALSGLLENTKNALAVGELLRAHYLLKGEYVFLGSDVLLTVKLVDVETSKTISFNETGSTDNLIHSLAEKLIQRLTGKTVALVDPDQTRSILSLKDESPGSIALFSGLIDGKIYVDDQLIGSTKGNKGEPIVIEKIKPGNHKVRVHVTNDFGVVILPQVEFRDWEETVKVESSKQAVVEDETRLFNDIIFTLRNLAHESKTLYAEKEKTFVKEYPFSFQDRKGVSQEGSLSLNVFIVDDQVTADFVLNLNGINYRKQLSIKGKDKAEVKQDYGLLNLEASLGGGGGRYDMVFYLRRTDVYAGMHKEAR